jgi:uncharacterized membrane protein YcaP (DUF421 family)
VPAGRPYRDGACLSEASFFDGWSGLVRVAVVGALAYVALVALLRVSGKRTLSKLNAFDLVVTVALGSTLATILLSKQTPLLEGVLAFALLIGMQLAITWLSVRSSRVSELVKSDPTLLTYEGRPLRAALKRERVTEEELRAAVRNAGFAELDAVAAVVLETDGSLTAVPRSAGHPSALAGLFDGVAGGDDSAGGRRADGADGSGPRAGDASRAGKRR